MTTHAAAPAQNLVREWLAAAGRGDLAAMKRHAESAPALIDAQGKGPYWTGRFRAMHSAAYRGDRRMLRRLLARGASAVALPKDADWAPIHFAAVPPKPEIVQLLRAHGASPRAHHCRHPQRSQTRRESRDHQPRRARASSPRRGPRTAQGFVRSAEGVALDARGLASGSSDRFGPMRRASIV
jgi:hypothetical protein